MHIRLNLRHLERQGLRLHGEISPADLDIENLDELVEVHESLHYDFWAEKLGQSILLHGKLRLVLECQCGRCLKKFTLPLEIDDWRCDLALEGEEKVTVDNDCVDLTPQIREDTLLAFPQHPLCGADCTGLPDAPRQVNQPGRGATSIGKAVSPWAELDKLKL